MVETYSFKRDLGKISRYGPRRFGRPSLGHYAPIVNQAGGFNVCAEKIKESLSRASDPRQVKPPVGRPGGGPAEVSRRSPGPLAECTNKEQDAQAQQRRRDFWASDLSPALGR